MGSIYLIKSNSYYLLNNKIKDLLNGVEDITKINLKEVELKDIIDDLLYTSLFEDKKAIIFDNTDYFGSKFLYEDDMELLKKYLSNLNENITVIFICNEISKSKSNTKDIIQLGAEIIDLTSIKDEEIFEVIDKYLADNKIKMDSNAIKRLYELVDMNIDLFLNEVEKISIVESNITNDVIDIYSSYKGSTSIYDFSNAILAKNFKDGFDVLDKLLDDNVEIPVLVGLLSSGYTSIYLVKDALINKLTDDEIIKMLEISKGALYYKKKNANIYTLDELKDIICNLSEVDKKTKTGSNPVYVFKEFLLSI